MDSIIYLGPDSPLLHWLAEREGVVVRREDPITSADVKKVSWIVSYNYRHILNPPILEAVDGRAVNLHISYLPWNRGADPNVWSLIDDTPKGVTIHFLDTGIDTGDIIAQRTVDFDTQVDTLATSHAKLQREIESLFRVIWPSIRAGTCTRHPQPSGGSFHYKRDRERLRHLLTSGWDTPISAIIPSRSRRQC